MADQPSFIRASAHLLSGLVLIILGLFVVPNGIHAQDQFVVTNAKDTIYGEVYTCIFSKKLKIRTKEGKKAFNRDELLGYNNGKHNIRIVKHMDEGKLKVHRLQLVVDGVLPLYRDWDENVREWAVYHDSKFIQIHEDNCSDWLWPMLMSCEAFSRALGHWKEFRISRLWYHDTEYALEIYNSLCR